MRVQDRKRQARFERCTGATSAREYLRLGGQKKDLRYDVSNGFFVEVDVRRRRPWYLQTTASTASS